MIFWILQVVFVALLAVFLNYPAPELTSNLKTWKQKGKYFPYRNHNIFYIDDDELPGKRDTLICLHGFPTSSYDWTKISNGLNTQFKRVIYLDFLGFGFSDKPYYHEYKVGEQADIVENLLRELNVKDVHILSHDFGDTVAQELIARQIQHGTDYEFNFKSLCMLNGGVFPDHYHPMLLQKLLLSPYIGVILTRLTNFYSFKRSLNAVLGPNTKLVNEDAWDLYVVDRFNDGALVRPSILKYLNERQENKHRWEGALQNTKVPVHFIYGPTDPIETYPEFTDYYKKLLPQHSIDILEENQIGHYPQWEAPVEVINSYKNFLRHVT